MTFAYSLRKILFMALHACHYTGLNNNNISQEESSKLARSKSLSALFRTPSQAGMSSGTAACNAFISCIFMCSA